MECLLSQGLNLLAHLALSYLILKLLWKVLKGFRVHIVSRVWRKDLKKYGGWAVVTGATDGIGKGYAEELAKRGFDVVLISRTLEKLQNVAKEIEQQTRRKTKVIQLDFTGGPDIYPKVEQELKKLDIGILVNNVGMAYSDLPATFLGVPDVNQKVTAIMNCNMMSAVQMTRIVLPNMIQRKKGLIINVSSEAGNHPYPMLNVYSATKPRLLPVRVDGWTVKKGLIINVSSELGNHPYPMVNVYCATKAFLDYFSRALNIEYKSKGITVQSVMPLVVSTNMTKNLQSNLFIKTANDFAREALNTVGYTDRTSGCLSHSIQSYFVNLIMSDSLLGSSLMQSLAKKANKSMGKRVRQKQQ